MAPRAEAVPGAQWVARMVCLQLGGGQRSTGQNSHGIAGSGGNRCSKKPGSQLGVAERGALPKESTHIHIVFGPLATPGTHSQGAVEKGSIFLQPPLLPATSLCLDGRSFKREGAESCCL